MAGDGRTVEDMTRLADQLIELANELLKHAGQGHDGKKEASGSPYAFKPEMRRFLAADEFVDLSENEASILDTLLVNKGNLVTKSRLCEVLGMDPVTQERNLKSYVYRLRCKLKRMKQPGIRIRPVHGSGYVLSEVAV